MADYASAYKHGWVHKRPTGHGVFHGWKKRYLMVEPGMVKWAAAPGSAPKGQMELDASTDVRICTAAEDGDFVITRGDRELRCREDDPGHAEIWAHCLGQAGANFGSYAAERAGAEVAPIASAEEVEGADFAVPAAMPLAEPVSPPVSASEPVMPVGVPIDDAAAAAGDLAAAAGDLAAAAGDLAAQASATLEEAAAAAGVRTEGRTLGEMAGGDGNATLGGLAEMLQGMATNGAQTQTRTQTTLGGDGGLAEMLQGMATNGQVNVTQTRTQTTLGGNGGGAALGGLAEMLQGVSSNAQVTVNQTTLTGDAATEALNSFMQDWQGQGQGQGQQGQGQGQGQEQQVECKQQ